MRKILWLVLSLALFFLIACQDSSSATLMPSAAPPDSGLAGGIQQLPTITASLTPTATASPPPTHTPTPSATPSPTATPTPLPSTLLERARRDLAYGDYLSALLNFERLALAPDTTEDEQRAAALGIGEVQLRSGSFADAEASLTAFLDSFPQAPESARASFWLAQARQGQMDWENSITAFQAYLALDETLTTYISDMIADSYLALGDPAAALAAYETALTGAATVDKIIAIRERVAQAYMASGEIDLAMAQYDAVVAIAQDDKTRARMDYLAGYALIVSDRPEEGYARYLHAVNNYPAAYDSYLALIELVDVGYPVDDFQRGLVDYYAGACIPAISSFYRYMEANLFDHVADAHLYTARCYAELGNYPAALSELEVLIETHQGEPLWDDAWLEKAKIQDSWGEWMTAVQTYLDFVEGHSDNALAPIALWRAAALWEENGSWEEAEALYRRLALDYPGAQDAPEALLRAGLMAFRGGENELAVQNWQRLVDGYPSSEWYAPALLWLVQILSPEEAAAYQGLAAALPPDSYYAIRAADLVSGVIPFEEPARIDWHQEAMAWLPVFDGDASKSVDQEEAEAWLKGWLGLEPGLDISSPSPVISSDPRWDRGLRLWDLNLISEARQELNNLRFDLSGDPLASYQLALAFRDIGLYRSSILAADAVIRLSPEASPLDCPPFIARLAYPAYYLDLVTSAAAEYGVDPLLLLSMIRQESLFESFARSWAAAQGLMQVIPSTGEYIARSLDWPNYRNEDLFKPVVSIPFGAFYLSEQLNSFDQNPYVALSAYNAGPGNASTWYQLAPDDLDFYLEIITLSEPRRYIQRIYTHYHFYRALYAAGELAGG